MLFIASATKGDMKKVTFLTLLLFGFIFARSQPSADRQTDLSLVRKVDHTSVKNQANTGTCWSFSTTSLVESQTLRSKLGEFDLSEMFVVRNIYMEKARNYVLRQGSAQFGPGGLGNDVINAIDRYGAVPESIYSGLLLGKTSHDHSELNSKLKSYLSNLLAKRPIPPDWMKGFQSILDDYLGKVPDTFTYKERTYTPLSFASEALRFRKDDYVFITSFSHHPYYQPFVLEIPDNYGGESYYNVPLPEMLTLVEKGIQNGYSLMWDADTSNKNFRQNEGFAMNWKDDQPISKPIDPDNDEGTYDQHIRQTLFENLTTEDDHLMHLVGLEKTKQGKKFFLVKNSWGDVGPFKGYIKVSEAYFAINTVSLVVPKEALGDTLKAKLGVK
jgi:bleomycin hydrolase